MYFKLPEKMYTWIWRGKFLAIAQQSEHRTKGGIYLPAEIDDRDAVVHFSQMMSDAEPRSWLWLFTDPQEAVSLRMCPQYASGPEMDLITQTLPSAPGEQDMCDVRLIDLDWLTPLIPRDIQEVWIGFNWKRYVQDRNFRVCTEDVIATEDFRAIAAR